MIRFSIAKMFAAKYRTRSVAKIFAKAGKDLGRPIKSNAMKQHRLREWRPLFADERARLKRLVFGSSKYRKKQLRW